MRRIRYCCAVSLDGYIAGPGGEFDWIVTDPEMDFGAMSEQFDAYLLGRKTFEATGGGDRSSPGVRSFVFSRTLRQSDYKNVTIVGENWRELVGSLREEPGKDIWLFGGGSLFRKSRRGGAGRYRRGRGRSDDARRRGSARRRAGLANRPDAEGAPRIREDGHRQPGLLRESLACGVDRTTRLRVVHDSHRCLSSAPGAGMSRRANPVMMFRLPPRSIGSCPR